MNPSADSRNVAVIDQTAAERRRHNRNGEPKELSVAWRYGGQNFVSNVCDLSLGGAFIQSAAPPPLGTILKLLFRMSGNFASAKAVVRRSVPGEGMGVEFLAMEQKDRACLALAAEWQRVVGLE
jgi:hypothetical protein